jgi:hypothetical protein
VLTSPLAPLQPDTLAGNRRYFWLERGVCKRGGYILLPIKKGV